MAGPLAAERPSDGGYPVNGGGLGLTRLRILTLALALAMGLGFAMTAGGPPGLAGDPGSPGGTAWRRRRDLADVPHHARRRVRH